MQQTRGKPKRLCLIFCAVLTLTQCWRWQRIFYLMCADYILSDMPAHVRLALGHNDYSLAPGSCAFFGGCWARRGDRQPCRWC
jgi:hypothetical protein